MSISLEDTVFWCVSVRLHREDYDHWPQEQWRGTARGPAALAVGALIAARAITPAARRAAEAALAAAAAHARAVTTAWRRRARGGGKAPARERSACHGSRLLLCGHESRGRQHLRLRLRFCLYHCCCRPCCSCCCCCSCECTSVCVLSTVCRVDTSQPRGRCAARTRRRSSRAHRWERGLP
eukprot:COSAG05_NODE_949_length_6474_cov_7.735216_5_plen_181_part_00